jgi:hypothetical protein
VKRRERRQPVTASDRELAWARAVGVITEYQNAGIMTVTTPFVIALLSLDPRRGAEAVELATERLAIPADADPLTGCLPVTARKDPRDVAYGTS